LGASGMHVGTRWQDDCYQERGNRPDKVHGTSMAPKRPRRVPGSQQFQRRAPTVMEVKLCRN